MTISSLIPAGTAPSSDRDVWAAPLAMQVNWKNPVTVRTGFETRIEQALTLSEQRRLMRGTPRRSISCTLTGTGRVETLSARQLLVRRSMAGFLMPLYSDQMETTADETGPSDNVQVASTQYRRCFAGDRAILLARKNGVTTQFEVLEIDSISPSVVTFTSNYTGTYPAGSVVVPLMESRLIDSYSNGFIFTDDKADFQNFTAQEAVGPSQLEGVSTVGSNPSGFDTFDSLPVFDGPVDYSQIRFGLNRIGSFSGVGIDQLPVFYGERAVHKFSALIQCTSRQAAWDFLRFFESRGGRAYPFFLRSPFEDYAYAGTNGNNVLVEDTGDLLDWSHRPYVALELSDGSYSYKEIESVVQNGDNHEISFTSKSLLGAVVGVRQLFKVRMFRDEVAERWLTTDRCQLTLEVVEVLEEKSVNMTETLSPETSDDITTEDGDLIGLGVAVGSDSTTAVSPDLSLGGCEAIVWKLVQCSGPSVGSTLYSIQDWSAYDGKSVHLSVDPAGTYRDVSLSTTVLEISIDDRDLLATIDGGPWTGTCGPPASLVPCIDCYPGAGGSDPNDGTIADGPVTCSGTDPVAPFGSDQSQSLTNFCNWQWVSDNTSGGMLDTFIDVWHAKNATTVGHTGGGCSGISLSAGEWGIQMWDEESGTYWQEKTSNFSCNPDTGKISGSHPFGPACTGTCVAPNPTFTVPG